MRARLGGLVLVLLAAATAVTANASASFTDGAAVAANSFSTGSTFGDGCPATLPAGVRVMLGFESGVVTSAGFPAGFFGVEQGSVGVVATTARDGDRSLRAAPSGAPGYGIFYLQSTSVTVARFALRFDTLPTADVPELFGFSDGTDGSSAAILGYQYNGGAPTFAIRVRDDVGALTAPVESTGTPVAGQWHLFDIRYDAGGTTHEVSWRVDGTDEAPASQPGAANTPTSLGWLGSTEAATYTAYFDDVVVSNAAGDYPLPDASVRRLVPDGTGTHNLLGAITNETGGSADADSWWQKLDEAPVGVGDYVEQTAVNTAAYAEVTFADTADSCIMAVAARLFSRSTGASNDATSEFRIVDGATTRTVWNETVDIGNTAGVVYGLGGLIAPVGASWTADELNGLVGRIGFASSIPVGAADPRWDAVDLEYLTMHGA